MVKPLKKHLQHQQKKVKPSQKLKFLPKELQKRLLKPKKILKKKLKVRSPKKNQRRSRTKN